MLLKRWCFGPAAYNGLAASAAGNEEAELNPPASIADRAGSLPWEQHREMKTRPIVLCLLACIVASCVPAPQPLPTAAASLDMAIEFVIEAFAVVVIGGLGSMRGALAGALIVGLIRGFSILLYPELEMLAIYLIVVAVLIFRPAGLFGRSLA